jgi:membrane protein implicated in regulation of membrane protease activity
MGLVYLFALVVSLGLFLLQAVMAGGGEGDAGGDHGGDHGDHGGEHGAEGEAHGEADGKGDHGPGGEHGALALLSSTRFWTFFALGFGLSGSLLHYLDLAGGIMTAIVAVSAGLGAGLFASFAFRAVKRAEVGSTASISDAVGRTGKVLIAIGPGKVGQIRVELKGHSVDLLATTDEGELARGEAVLVEAVEGNTARVCRRPAELA